MIDCRYDPNADAVYVTLGPHIRPGEAVLTVPVDPVDANGDIMIDFDAQGRVLGIEILDASRMLKPEFLKGCFR